MMYVLFILFIANEGLPTASVATYSAEFVTSEACWSASESIRAPLEREDQYRITTITTCVAKGQKPF